MTAGFNQILRVWRYSTPLGTDDVSGGAQPTGTVLYPGVEGRIYLPSPTMALLDQGLETGKIFTISISGMAIDTRENDVVECVAPVNSFYYGDMFRIIGTPRPSIASNDSRRYLIANARRYELAHGNEQL